MVRGWQGESKRHSLAARGISTTSDIKTPIQTLDYSPQAMTGYLQDEQGNVVGSGPINDISKQYFGTTEDFLEAGYILPDGTMLDFSGKKFGGNAGVREMDHRQISDIMLTSQYETPDGASGSDAMIQYQKQTGAIRFMKFPDGDVRIDAFQRPTSEQARKVGESLVTYPYAKNIIFERTDEKGYTVDSLESDHPHPILVQKFISKAF